MTPEFGLFVTEMIAGPEIVVVAIETQIVWPPDGPHVGLAASTGIEAVAESAPTIITTTAVAANGER